MTIHDTTHHSLLTTPAFTKYAPWRSGCLGRMNCSGSRDRKVAGKGQGARVLLLRERGVCSAPGVSFKLMEGAIGAYRILRRRSPVIIRESWEKWK